MNFDKTQQELLVYVKENKIWKQFVPIAEVLNIVLAVLAILANFISFGIFETVFTMLRYISIVMVLAKANYKVLTIGLGLSSLDNIIYVLQGIFRRNPTFRIASFLWAIFYGLFAIAAFKKSKMSVDELKKSVTSIDGIKSSMNLEEAKTFNMSEAVSSAKEGIDSTVKMVKEMKKPKATEAKTTAEEKEEQA